MSKRKVYDISLTIKPDMLLGLARISQLPHVRHVDRKLLEQLDLTGVPQGNYKFMCLPLKIKDADGAPAPVSLQEVLGAK